MPGTRPTPTEKSPLLKKGKHGLLRLVFSRMGLVVLLLLLQVGGLFALYNRFQAYFPQFYSVFTMLSAVMVVYLLNVDTDPDAKITWLVLVMLLPAAGVLLYLYVHTDLGHRALRDRMRQIRQLSASALPENEDFSVFSQDCPEEAGLAHYLRTAAQAPVYQGCPAQYFSSGEDFFPAFLTDLRNAKRFIFLEYFIIEQGEMWSAVEKILAEKTREGVEVRVLYDGTCEFFKLPRSFPEHLQSLGIQCRIFSRIKPFVSTHYNYRDHRKIAVIDGKAGYTGGLNLADEYINRTHPFGHWKDTALRLEGAAVGSFTLMFLQMWQVEDWELSFAPYLTHLAIPTPPPQTGQGYVIPYGDCPLDDQPVGEWVYTHILSAAQSYVHIMTPYLILGHEMENALKFAAQRGVEVTLILPHIPDKKIAFALAKSHYPALMACGVKIYEYIPGFIHAKSFVSDGIRATVGTINLDYRSLRHHFECGTYLCGAPCVADIEADFQATLKKCQQVAPEQAAHPGFYYRMLGLLMKVLAPLL